MVTFVNDIGAIDYDQAALDAQKGYAVSSTIGAVAIPGIEKAVSVGRGIFAKEVTKKVTNEVVKEGGEAVLKAAAEKGAEEVAKKGLFEGAKAIAGKGVSALGAAVPLIGPVMAIGFEAMEFKGEMEKISKYCEDTGLEFNMMTVFVNPNVRGAVMESVGELALNSGANLIATAAPFVGFFLTMGVKLPQIYDDIKNPDAIQLTSAMQEQLDSPQGQISLSQVGDGAIKVVEATNPDLARELTRLRDAKEPAYAETVAMIAQVMEKDGNAARTLNYLAQSGEIENLLEIHKKQHPPELHPEQALGDIVKGALGTGVLVAGGLAAAAAFGGMAVTTLPFIAGGIAVASVGGLANAWRTGSLDDVGQAVGRMFGGGEKGGPAQGNGEIINLGTIEHQRAPGAPAPQHQQEQGQAVSMDEVARAAEYARSHQAELAGITSALQSAGTANYPAHDEHGNAVTPAVMYGAANRGWQQGGEALEGATVRRAATHAGR
jgi:hypothetical protein